MRDGPGQAQVRDAIVIACTVAAGLGVLMSSRWDARASSFAWSDLPIYDGFDPRIGSQAQCQALQFALAMPFRAAVDSCFQGWHAPANRAGADHILEVRLELALGIETVSGRSRIAHVSIERQNLSDAAVEDCFQRKVIDADVTLPQAYAVPGRGELRSVAPLRDGRFRLSYAVKVGAPVH